MSEGERQDVLATIAVCIITYRRPSGLARCLESIARLQFTKHPSATLRVVVVDNDVDGSARPVVEQYQDQFTTPIIYAVETERGISFARNRSIALAEGCEFVAFIDDDEYAEPAWLDELYNVQRTYDADIVCGMVLPEFETIPPQWARQGRFFEKRGGKTGTQLRSASTANVLFRRDVLQWVEGPFDPRFALTGGSDAFLSKQLFRRGARIVWCDEAVVHEVIPPNRATVRWVIQRSYRRGNTVALCEATMTPQLRRSLSMVFKRGAWHVIRGTRKLAVSPFNGRTAAVRSLAEIAEGCGTILGLAGHRYQEYRDVQGT